MSGMTEQDWKQVTLLLSGTQNRIVEAFNLKFAPIEKDIALIKQDIRGNGGSPCIKDELKEQKDAIKENAKGIQELKILPDKIAKEKSKIWIPIIFTTIVFLFSPLIKNLWDLIFK